jgi:hypothetical protein
MRKERELTVLRVPTRNSGESGQMVDVGVAPMIS